jgi:hypothetical protein
MMKYLIVAIISMFCMACSNNGPKQFEDDKSHLISWGTGSCVGKLVVHSVTYTTFYDAICDDGTKVYNLSDFTVK